MTLFERQEEMASNLRSKGFDVQYEVEGKSGTFYDMVAQRDGEAIVFEFKPQSKLSVSSPATSRLRQLAQQDGYQDFRLVIMPEEKHKSIEVFGLDKALLLWLQSNPKVVFNSALEGYNVIFQRVSHVLIDSLVSQSGMQGANINGSGVVDFQISTNGKTTHWDCPFSFAAHLDSTWQLDVVHGLYFDLGSIGEDLQEFLSGESA